MKFDKHLFKYLNTLLFGCQVFMRVAQQMCYAFLRNYGDCFRKQRVHAITHFLAI